MSDSAQYDTQGRFLRKIRINWRNFAKNRTYFNPLLSGPGRLELWRKKWSKISFDTLGRFINIQITQPKLNQNPKYFNPLVSGPGWIKWRKKTGGRKSRWTVPLNLENRSGPSKIYDRIRIALCQRPRLRRVCISAIAWFEMQCKYRTKQSIKLKNLFLSPVKLNKVL